MLKFIEREVKCYKLVGLKYYSHGGIREGDAVDLHLEPDNEYDKNAVGVWWRDYAGDMQQIGYIKRAQNEDLLERMSKYDHTYACIAHIFNFDKPSTLIIVRVFFCDMRDEA